MNPVRQRPLLTLLWRTAIAGGVAAAVETAFFIVLINSPWRTSPFIANPLAFVAGTVINYWMCRLWVFHKSQAQLHREAVQFAGIALIGLAGQVILFNIVFGLVGHAVLSKLSTMACMFFVNFSMKRRLFTGDQDTLARRVRGAYARLPLLSRLHLYLRWHSCPVEEIIALLPHKGALLDIGCGRGLMSVSAALTSPGLNVYGIDIDPDKIADATAATAHWPTPAQQIAFASTEPTAPLPAGPWQAITIIDVLYLMKRDQQIRLLEQAATQLSKGGVLIIKHMDTRPAWKMWWAKLQEKVAVGFIGLTKGEHTFVFLTTQELVAILAQAGLQAESYAVDKGYPYPHRLIIARRTTE